MNFTIKCDSSTHNRLSQLAEQMNRMVIGDGIRFDAKELVGVIMKAYGLGLQEDCADDLAYARSPIEVCSYFQSRYLRPHNLHCSYALGYNLETQLTSCTTVRRILDDSGVDFVDASDLEASFNAMYVDKQDSAVSDTEGEHATDENYALKA